MKSFNSELGGTPRAKPTYEKPLESLNLAQSHRMPLNHSATCISISVDLNQR
jgi:hypothetical protein